MTDATDKVATEYDMQSIVYTHGNRYNVTDGYDIWYGVIGGYSNLFSVGIFPVIFQLAFRVHMYVAAGAFRASDVAVHLCLRGVGRPSGPAGCVAVHLCLCGAGRSASALTSRDHLIDWTIVFRRCGRSFCKNVRAQLISEQIASVREFRAGKPSSSEQCSSTFEFEQSSRLLTSSSQDDLSSRGTSVKASNRVLCAVVRWPM